MGGKQSVPRSLGCKVSLVWTNLWKGWKDEDGKMEGLLQNRRQKETINA
jgi:hypothetical protein